MRGTTGGRLHLGSSLHASTAVFDRAKMEGSPVTPDDAAGEFVDYLHRGADVDWEDLSIKTAERIGLDLHTQYCTTISPRYEFCGVEEKVSGVDIEVPEHKVTLRVDGTLDRSRFVTNSQGIGISDLKSGGRAVSADGTAVTKGHWPQLGLYEIGAEVSTGQKVTEPAQIIGLQTTNKPKVGVGEIAQAKQRLLGDGEHPGLIELAADMLARGYFPPNPRSLVCHEKYCPRWDQCIYHD